MIHPHIRPAVADDAAEILALVRELASYEKLSDEVDATQDSLSAALFGDNPRVFCEIAEAAGGRVVGFALWFYTFSTFRGRHSVWLEDLYVRPDWRRHGFGRALMAAVARRCVAENLPRLEWSVLDWNQPAIDFYEANGAKRLQDWTICRVTDAALWRLADHAR